MNIVFIDVRGLNDPHLVSKIFLSRIPADSCSVSMNHAQQFEICVSHSDVSKGSVLSRCDSRVTGRVVPGVSKDRSFFIAKDLLWTAWLLKINTLRFSETSGATQQKMLRHLLQDLNLHLQNFISIDHEV